MFGMRVEAMSLNEISSYSQFCLAWTVCSQEHLSLDLTPQQLRIPHAKNTSKANQTFASL